MENIHLPNSIQKSKELLSYLLKKSLDSRLRMLEQKDINEKKNLCFMKDISKNMINYLNESSNKLKIKKENNINNEKNIINNFSKSMRSFHNNKNKEYLQSKTPGETTPSKIKRVSSKEKLFWNKTLKKKNITITPINTSPNDKIKISNRRFSKINKKININYKSEINTINTNDNNKKGRKKKMIIHLKKSNTNLLVTKQNNVLSNKTNEKNNNKITNKKRFFHIKNSRTISTFTIRNKKLKKNHLSFHKKNNLSNLFNIKKKNYRNNNIGNDWKSKTTLKEEKRYNNKNLSNIKKELDLLCDNTLFENDIRLNELIIDDLQQNNNKIQNKIISPINLCKIKYRHDLLLLNNNLNMNQNDKCYKKINLEENLESCIEYINEYLSIKDLFNLGLINKEFFKIIIRYFISKTEKKIESINNKINELTKIYKNIDLNEKNINKFKCNINSSRAITLLNSISINNIFNLNSSLVNNKDIIFIFQLFFIAIGRKKEILEYNEDNIQSWNYICKYFKGNEKKAFGNIVEKELINRNYNNEIINSLYEWTYRYSDKITPNYYKTINKDIAIFVFIIRDLLDFFGITQDKKVNPQKIYILHNIRLNIQDKLIQRLNKLLIKTK